MNITKYLSRSCLYVGTLLLLQACGSQVDCNDSESKAKAIEIIQTQLMRSTWYREMRPALSEVAELVNIKTLQHNENTNASACQGSYKVTYNGKPRELEVRYNLSYLQDSKSTEVVVGANDVVIGLMSLAQSERPLKNGKEEIVDPTTGKLQRKRFWNNNALDGDEEFYDVATGNLQHRLPWKNGVLDGVETIYNPETKKLIAEIHISNGLKTGSEKRWDSAGERLLVDLIWKDAKPTGTELGYDVTGQKKIIDLTWKDGNQTGLLIDGVLDSRYTESHFKDGVKDGEEKIYAKAQFPPYNMYLEEVKNYKEGKLDGVYKHFDMDGKLSWARKYRDDIEVPLTPADLKMGERASLSQGGNLNTDCVDRKTNAYRREMGSDALINADVLAEWEGECTK